MTDTQLIRLAQDGNQQAIGHLYDQYVDAIYRYFYWQTNKRTEDAQDLTQDVFIEMAKSIHTFKGEGSFKNWLYTIAKYRLSKWIKAKYDLPVSPLFENIIEIDEVTDLQVQDSKLSLLNEILDQLKPRAKSILQLRFLRNYSVAETAQELGMSESNVKVITHRSLKFLQAYAIDIDY